MIILLVSVLTLIAVGALFMQQNPFGKLPSGKRLARIEQSPNYKDGSFQNLEKTPMMAEDASYIKLMLKFFSKIDGREPGAPLPSVKTNLKNLSSVAPTIIWFGHSSYLIHVNGKNILIDPVLNERASPVQFFGSENYPGTSVYSVDDLPAIDVVIISHDHYDHLGYNTIQKLKSKTKMFYTSLGVGEHLAYWGVPESNIVELDWWDSQLILPGIQLTAAPARHFSGRGFVRGKSLWSSFILKTETHQLFIGADSGYDATFKKIGEKFGSFDLVILECGQYDAQWPNIHMMPEEVAQAARDLNGKVLMPVHWGKFTLALHKWNEPIERVIKRADELGLPVTTPMIGEPLVVDTHYPKSKWWNLGG